MAFLAGPAALALLGGIAAPGAAFSTLGAAVGWTVGAWLFGPKANSDNQIFDPGAEEMPRINQALRGATMPVFFGTNRVSSNIVWTANFTTVRKESTTGGGGKAGGSGGAKMGSAPAQVSYEYKWDMMFHIGMSPVPVTLYGGWVNTDKLNPDVIRAILEGSGNSTSILPDSSEVDDTQLAFEDSYFGAAYSSTSESQEPWDLFESVEGQPARFPHTAYIGFDQLYLGASPRIPQFTWEVGPGTSQFTGESGFVRTIDAVPLSLDVQASPGGAFMMKLDNGDLVYPIRDGTGSEAPYTIFFNVSNGESYQLDGSVVEDRLELLGLKDPSEGIFSNGIPVVQVPGTKYFYTVQRLQDVGNFWLAGVLYSIEDDGSFVPYFGYRLRGSGVTVPLIATAIKVVGLYGAQSEFEDPVLAITTASTGRFFVLKLPSVGFCQAGNLVNNDENALTLYFKEVEALDDFFTSSVDRGVRFDQYGYVVPTASIGVLGITWQTYFWFVSSRSEVSEGGSSAWQIEQDPLYPDGYITQLQVAVSPTTGYLTVGSPVVNNTIFEGADGETLTFPFEDGPIDRDGTAADSLVTDYVAPNIQKLPSSIASNLWLMLWPKWYDPDPSSNFGTEGNYAKVRAFIWNPFTGKAVDYGSQEGSFFDDGTDFGVNNVENYRGFSVAFDTANSEVLIIGHYTANAAMGNRAVIGTFGTLQIGGQTDVTPAYIVYTILTHPVLGAGVPESMVDQDSYAAAVAYCEVNEIKVSVQYNREDNLLAVLEQLLSLFNCFLVISGGKIKFGLQDFSVTPVRTLDNHHLVTEEGRPPVQTVRGARQDSYNKVRVNYFDRALSYRQNQIEVSDEVDIDLNGVRVKEFPPKFVMNEALANNIAIRALWTNLYARDTYNFKIGPKDRDLEPGDPITLVDSFDQNLSSGVRVRIGRIRQVDPAVWEVTAVRELDYTQTATLAAFNPSSPANRGPIIGGVQPPLDFRAYELPAELQTTPSQVHFGYNPGAMAAGARLYVSPDGITYGVAGDIQPFVINGMFANGLATQPTGWVDYNVEVYLSPTSDFNPASPTWVQTYAIDDVTEAARQTGAGIIIAGSEALAMENLTLLGQNHYRIGRLYRGWGGTQPQDHSSGAYWHRHASGVLGLDITEDKIGTQFYYKVQPYNFSGVGYDIASIAAKTWTVKDIPALPQPVQDLQVFATSATVSQSIALPSGRYRRVAAGGSPVALRWRPASRSTGFGAGGYGAGQYGRFARDVATPSYRVEVLSGNTVVRSTVVNTEAFDYSVANNSADFNAWAGQFQFRVTEYNSFGDAPYSAVHSVILF